MTIAAFLYSVFFKLPAGFLITVLLLFASLAILPFDPAGRRQRALVPVWARCILHICGIEVHVGGIRNLDPNRQYIFVSNHSSWLDIAVLISTLPHELCFFAKKELFWMPLVGTCLRRSRQIPIDRKHALPAASRLRAASRMLSGSGRSMVLFPEGTRSESEVLRFKNGAAYLAMETGIPIVPIGLSGTQHLMPKGSAIVRSGIVGLNIGCPVYPEACSSAFDVVSRELRRTVELLVVNHAPAPSE